MTKQTPYAITSVMAQPGDERQRTYYQETAADYDALHCSAESPHDRALEHVAAACHRLGLKTILDVGCGTGRGLRFLAAKGIEVHGVEPVPELVEQAVLKHGVPREWVDIGDARRLPYGDGAFDAVVACGIMHHVDTPAVVITELTRVARRAVFISDSNRFGMGSLPARIAKLVLKKARLWHVANYLKTRGKGYTESEGDGIAYSYSIYDSLAALSRWSDSVSLIPTERTSVASWLHPLLTCGHILVCAEKL